jgi:hypothetical protein
MEIPGERLSMSSMVPNPRERGRIKKKNTLCHIALKLVFPLPETTVNDDKRKGDSIWITIPC